MCGPGPISAFIAKANKLLAREYEGFLKMLDMRVLPARRWRGRTKVLEFLTSGRS